MTYTLLKILITYCILLVFIYILNRKNISKYKFDLIFFIPYYIILDIIIIVFQSIYLNKYNSSYEYIWVFYLIFVPILLSYIKTKYYYFKYNDNWPKFTYFLVQILLYITFIFIYFLSYILVDLIFALFK